MAENPLANASHPHASDYHLLYRYLQVRLRKTQDLTLQTRLRCSIGGLYLSTIVAAVDLDAVSRLDPVIGFPIELAIWT